MELLKVYTALLRRKWLVIQSVVFFVAAGGLLALLLPRNYTATARVLVSTNDSTLSILSDLGLSEVAAGMSSASDDISNKISLATTRPVLEEVIWRLQLRDDDGRLYTHEEVLVPGLTGEIEARPNISVAQQQGTDILAFEARANDPELARLLADTVVRVAVLNSQERGRAETSEARRFIQGQLEVVKAEFDVALADIADAQSAEEVIDLESEMKAAIARLSELLLAGETNAAAIQETRARIAEQRAYQGKESRTGISPTTEATNVAVADLNNRLRDLREKRLAQVSGAGLTEKHPDIIQIDKLIAMTEQDLEQALAEQHALDPGEHNLQSQLQGYISKGAEIQAAIQRTTVEFSTYPDKMRRMSQLKLAAVAAENVYKSLQEQKFQIGVAEAMIVSDLQLVEVAKAPDRQSSPKLVVNLVMGLILGLGFGTGLAFLFEYIDDTVRTPDDLSEVWKIARLGVIPKFKTKSGGQTIHELPVTDPISESYRTVRNGLLFASLDKPLKIIGVSSAMPGEGKSTFTVNLGISFAREGKRVIIVDCDLRKPAQHRSFPEVSNHVGLTSALTGEVALADAVQHSPVAGLDLLCSGPTPPDPARLVESLKLRQVLLDLQKSYDIVLVDTPPGLVVNDALVIARAIDGMVLVVESLATSRKLIADLRDRFEAGGVQPIGIVLNKMDFFAAGYGHYLKVYKQYEAEAKGLPAATEEPGSKGGVG